jgi:site-specific recombinase XerD
MEFTIEKFVTNGIRVGKNGVSANSRKNYTNHLGQFERWLASKQKTFWGGKVTSEDINVYFHYMKNKGYKQNSLAIKMATIRSYFQWLRKQGAITHVPTVPQLKSETIIHRKVDEKDIFTLLNHAKRQKRTLKGARDAAMLALITHCGLKTEQVVHLLVKNVDLDNLSIVIDKKTIPMGSAEEYVRKYYDEITKITPLIDGPFFLNKNKHKITGRSFRRHLEKIQREANLFGKFKIRDLVFSAKN